MQLHTAILVDDEVFTRKGLIKLINWETCGFQIVGEADNGEDALELIKRINPELVITDIRMPVIDGLELIRLVGHEDTPTPSFIIISGYNDFKYAQQAVRYGVHDFVLKPIDEQEFSNTLIRLKSKLDEDRDERIRTEQQIRSAMIESILLGEAEEEKMIIWEQGLNLEKDDRLFYLFAELNDNQVWQTSNAEEFVTLPRFKELLLMELLELTQEEHNIYLHEHRNRLGVLLTDRLLKPFDGNLELFLTKLRHNLALLLGNGVFLYAGVPVKQLSGIRQSFAAAKEALLYKYVNDDKRIVIYDDVKDEPLHYIGFDPIDFNQFMEHIEELESTAVSQFVDNLFHQFREKRYAPEAVKMNIQQCVMGITKTIRNMEGDEHSLVTLTPIINWHDMNLTLGELKKLFSAFIDESQLKIAELRKDQLKGGIQKIRSYIEVNYSNNISLKSIAAQFYINPVYLGQLFKKTYGVYFNEFLLQLRVNEAKKLLRQAPSMRIYEIAEKVGFSNADYFVTQFEKIEHMTPTEYRNKLV